MNTEKKIISLRLEPELMDGLGELAKTDYRSLNGEIEYLIARELSERCGLSNAALFKDYAAFTWRGDRKRLEPVRHRSPVRLSDLKLYESEKREVIDNTLGFLRGLPAQNILLYGDRGTGKSATVHAVLNEYANKGLRLAELKKSDISDFPRLSDALTGADDAYKFIVFIDDLTFADDRENYAELKNMLEGSISRLNNIVVYATSNRRHIIKESFSARDDLHPGDTLHEQVSLSDRFGITVTFVKPDKDEFFTILNGLLTDRGIKINAERLTRTAERFCLEKGGRSPRGARQLADIIESKIKRGLEF